MKKLLLALVCTILLLMLAVWLWTVPKRAPDNQAFINGQVLTMDATNSIVEAVLLEGNRIVAVGSTQTITNKLPAGTKVHDLQGRTLIPGFVDAHSHFPASGVTAVAVDLNSPPIGNTNSINEMLAKMKTKAADTKSGKWLFGLGYDDTLLPEARHPNLAELDSISTEHPIFVLHISGHIGVANSLALEKLGINKQTPDPIGGVIGKDANGELTGLLEETAVIEILEQATAFSLFDTLKIARQATDEYLSMGVTTAQNGAADRQILDGLKLASKYNLVPLRLEVWPADKNLGKELLTGNIKAADYQTDKMRVARVKLMADGSIQGYTGFLGEPYHVVPKQPVKAGLNEQGEYVGYPNQSRAALADLVNKHRANGMNVAIHGNGDAAIDNIIYAVEKSYQQIPQGDERIILIHAQMSRDDQLDKMLELGITPSFFSAHTYYWGDRHHDIFMGPERAVRMSPTRTAVDKGLKFSIHLDSPVVPMNPMLMIWSTVKRESTSGRVIGTAERISPMQALRATTIDAAWQIFQEDKVGSIEVGKLADLVILNGDPLTAGENGNPPIKDINVDETFIDGVSVFKRQ